MHIVLSGYYGFDNVGDEAILFSIIQALKKIQPDITITVLSNNPESTKKTYGVQAVNRWSFKEIRTVIKNSDGLISGGGSLLQDETGIRSIPYYTGIMRIAMWYKKSVFIYAQGMGPINRKVSQWLTRWTLNRTDRITVRDTDSKQLLEKIGVDKDISIVPDPVLGLDGFSFDSDWFKKQTLDNSFVSVSVRDWPTEVDFKRKIAACLDEFVKKGYTVVFVPMHGEHDEKTSKETAQLMTETSIIAPGNLSIGEKISIIGKSNVLVGMRLHSLIFAAITYTPFIAISYDPKIDSFAEICNQPVAGHVEEDDWDSGKLIKLVSHALDTRLELEKVLETKVKIYKEKALETPAIALDELSKDGK